jgi:hypothetical protein
LPVKILAAVRGFNYTNGKLVDLVVLNRSP